MGAPASGAHRDMSDLDPHLTPFEVELVDPAVTRLVSCDGAGAAASLLDRLGPIATSLSFVVPDDPRSGEPLAATLRDWKPGHLRVEVLGVSATQDRRTVVSGEPDVVAVPLRTLSRPLGGRAAVLAAAVEAAEHDFIVVTPPDEVPLGAMAAAMGHMWSEGCDAALVETTSPDGALTLPTAVDAAGELAAWLAQANGSGRLVILRRWVARWLFNEVNRAIDPWVEVADRARLLGIGIVHLRADAPQPGVAPPQASADLR